MAEGWDRAWPSGRGGDEPAAQNCTARSCSLRRSGPARTAVVGDLVAPSRLDQGDEDGPSLMGSARQRSRGARRSRWLVSHCSKLTAQPPLVPAQAATTLPVATGGRSGAQPPSRLDGHANAETVALPLTVNEACAGVAHEPSEIGWPRSWPRAGTSQPWQVRHRRVQQVPWPSRVRTNDASWAPLDVVRSTTWWPAEPSAALAAAGT